MDIKVWEPTVLEMFESLGNDVANGIWEARLVPLAATSGGGGVVTYGPLSSSSWCSVPVGGGRG